MRLLHFLFWRENEKNRDRRTGCRANVWCANYQTGPGHQSLRIHDPFSQKTTWNVTFMPFLWCHFISNQDRPNKVYISLKLRASCIHFKNGNQRKHTCKNVLSLRIGHMGDPDPRGGIEIQLSQYLKYMSIGYFIIFCTPLMKKACLRILIFQLKVSTT